MAVELICWTGQKTESTLNEPRSNLETYNYLLELDQFGCPVINMSLT